MQGRASGREQQHRRPLRRPLVYPNKGTVAGDRLAGGLLLLLVHKSGACSIGYLTTQPSPTLSSF
jgi:hypothetical protein